MHTSPINCLRQDELVDVDTIEPELSTDFEENALHQEEIIHEIYEKPGKEYLQELPELLKEIDSKVIYLNRQTWIKYGK